MGIREVIGRPFAFLFERSQAEELVAEYVIREHKRGRTLAEILQDAYVTNRLTPEQADRLLDRPDVIQAIGGAKAVKAETEGAPADDAEPPASGSPPTAS